MFNKSYTTILAGLLSMMIASVMFYFKTTSFVSYALLVIGFFLVGIGILLGFSKMTSEDEKGKD